MVYSVSKITTAADCDLLMSMAGKQKSALEFRQTSLQRKQSSYSANTVDLDAELQIVNAEVSALETVIAALPDGGTKEQNVTKKKKLELKQYLLSEKKGSNGSVALLQKEYELGCVSKDLDETTAFIAALLARKAEL